MLIPLVAITSSCFLEPAVRYKNARILRGYLDIFEPAKKKYVKWHWDANDKPVTACCVAPPSRS